jgi:hypothetical protein
MRNLFTSPSLAGLTYCVLCITTKNGGKFPRGIYNIGCKLPIMCPYQQRVQQYVQPGVIPVLDLSFLVWDIKETGYDRVTYKFIVNEYDQNVYFFQHLQVILICMSKRFSDYLYKNTDPLSYHVLYGDS